MSHLIITTPDEEDDTAAQDEAAAAGVSAAMAPEGFRIVSVAPSMDNRQEENELIGKVVLFKWDGAPLDASEFGWYRGTIAKRATEPQIKTTAGVNFQVRFVNSETNCTIPARFGKGLAGAKKYAFVPLSLGLTQDVWGPEKKWVLIENA